MTTSVDALALALLDTLGIDPTNVAEVTLQCAVNEAPTLRVVRWVDNVTDDGTATVLHTASRYRVELITEETA